MNVESIDIGMRSSNFWDFDDLRDFLPIGIFKYNCVLNNSITPFSMVIITSHIINYV
jgi:hypothetical protein